MKYLVTGGAGFIGSNLCRNLVQAGHTAVVLDNYSTGYRENLTGLPSVQVVEGDILTFPLEDLMQGLDGVFHMAACVGNVRSIEDPLTDASVNILGTLRVLQAMRVNKVRNFVYSSSAATFGEPRYLPVDEDHPQNPDSPYGVSKLAGEKNALAYGRLFDFKVVCLRYFNVYGALQRFDAYGNVIPIFAQRLLAGKALKVYGDGQQTRDFVHVNDVVAANRLAMEHEQSGVFNIGSGEPQTVTRLIETLIRVTGISPQIEYEPRRKGEVLHSSTTLTTARAQLRYSPSTSLEVGLSEYWAWMSSVSAQAN